MALYKSFRTPIAENVVPEINTIVLSEKPHNITNFHDLNYSAT